MSCKVNNHVTAIILAAGVGSRMECETPKHMLKICGDSVIRRTVRSFDDADSISSIVVVCRDEYIAELKKELNSFKKVNAIVAGGESRMKSAKLGFSAVSNTTDFVAIHDAARCLITPEMINAVVCAAVEHGAASAGAYVYDTVKKINGDKIEGTVPRAELFLAQTPQCFSSELYAKALASVHEDNSFTDDNGMLESIGVSIKCVNTGSTNIKITVRDDLAFAEYIIKKRGNE